MTDLRTQLLHFLDQARRRRWTALLVAWLVCVIGWAAVALMPDKYVSEARFHVDTTSLLTPLLKGISVDSDDRSRDRQVAIMQRTLASRPNLQRVVQMTDLDKAGRSESSLQDMVTSLEKRITIASQGPNLFLLQFTDNSPQLAKNVLQALLTIFVESSIGDKREDIKGARTFIDGQVKEYETQLKASEQRLADFKVKNIQYLSSSSQNYATRLETAQEAQKNAKFEADDALAERDRLSQQLSTTPQFLALDVAPQAVAGSGVRGSLQQRIRGLQGRLDDMKLQFTDKHPDVVIIQQALDRLLLEQAAAAETRDPNSQPNANAIQSQVPNELHNQLALRLAEATGRAATARRKLLEAQAALETLQTRASEAPRVEAELANINRDYEVLKTTYDAVLQRRELARVAAAADSTTEPIQFRMVAAPELPSRPSGPPRTPLNIAVLFIGLVAGAGSIVLLAKIINRVSTIGDLADFPRARLLGSVSEFEPPSPKNWFRRWFGAYGFASLGLIAVFAIVLVTHPNLSSLLQTGKIF
ncbi:MAG: XrtA system polysaccharide chain length determinant [Rhodospirillaceae bacterium]